MKIFVLIRHVQHEGSDNIKFWTKFPSKDDLMSVRLPYSGDSISEEIIDTLLEECETVYRRGYRYEIEEIIVEEN